VADAGLKLTVVGQQQQTFTVGIQPAGHVHARDVNEVLEPAPAR
jgi:hypothetical protein